MSIAKKVVNAARSRKKLSNKMKNKIILVLDKSGSMDRIAPKAREVFNQQIRNIQDVATSDKTQETLVVVHQFDGILYRGGNFTTPENVPLLNIHTYRADGASTALMDAIGEAINLANDDGVSSYVLIVVTDGDENSSTKFRVASLTNLIDKVNKTDRWSIVCLVPPGATYKTASYGIPTGNITEWEGTDKGVENAGAMLGAGINQYYAVRQTGATSTRGFFTTDLTNVSKKDLKQCRNVSGDYYIWEVDQNCRIDDFVKVHQGSYEAGRGFYQLTKTEKVVQFDKSVVILDKTTGMMYSGEEARNLLGLPSHNVSLKPGNHGNFDLFIMSKSFNRKLMSGTRMLYRR